MNEKSSNQRTKSETFWLKMKKKESKIYRLIIFRVFYKQN